MAYFLLFLSALIAATLLPAQSEATLIALLYQGRHQPWLLIMVASMGNMLGSCINWWLGRQMHRFRAKRWFPFNELQIKRAEIHYRRYGVYTLLLSWLPIIGDPLTLIAGVLREQFWRFLMLVSIAKTGRYVILYLIYLGVV